MINLAINGDLRMKGHVTVRVSHLIRVDRCIAKEIAMLNNKYNIVSEFSCCGHANGFGWVTVKVDDYSDEVMAYLGYKELALPREWVFTVSDKDCRKVCVAVRKVYQLKTQCTCNNRTVSDKAQVQREREQAYRTRNHLL